MAKCACGMGGCAHEKADAGFQAPLKALNFLRAHAHGGGQTVAVAWEREGGNVCRYDLEIPKRIFTIRYDSDIPNRLGLAGSSAIITATMRAMCRFYRVSIPREELANLVLATERDELGIPAGLQDRVAQAYNEPVYMDFDEKFMRDHGYGRYTPIEIPDELKLFVAYRTDLAEKTFALARTVFEHSLDLRREGTAELDLCSVAAGRAGLSFELHLSLWDYAAGALLVEEAGGVCRTAEGKPLPYTGEKSSVVTAASEAVMREFLRLAETVL